MADVEKIPANNGIMQPGTDIWRQVADTDVRRLAIERAVLGTTEGILREGEPMFEELRRMDQWRSITEQKLFKPQE